MHKLCIFNFPKTKVKNVIQDISNDNETLKTEFAKFLKPLKDIKNRFMIKF